MVIKSTLSRLKLRPQNISTRHVTCYENIFGRQVARIKEAATALAAAMEIRNDLLNPITPDEDDAAQ